MNLNIILKRSVCLLFAIATVSSLTSCQPDEVGSGNGLSAPNVDAAFTIIPEAGSPNKFTLVAQPVNVLGSKWDLGDGGGMYVGKMEENIFLPDAGTYTITHGAIGKGGIVNTTSQNIVVATSDPAAGNIVKGGKFLTANDNAQWTLLNLNTNGNASWTFNSGSATIHSNGGWAQEGIYQAIDVVKDKEYTIDMLVSATSGSNETWFEVYAGKSFPTSGVEYKDNKVMGLSTWDGCATAAFQGKLSSVGCVKNDVTKTVSNVVKFTETGKIYLVIRCGGNTFTPGGITITNVEFRGKS
jgi:hypothetical protein